MATPIRTPLDRRYGSWRGALRLALAFVELRVGRSGVRLPDRRAVRRLVFVCQGNICRSAFADVAARGWGLETASFGLATTAGLPAHDPAIVTAAARGIDLSGHRTSRVEDYQPRPGDLLLAMETRQLRRLAADPRLAQLPRALLGSWSRPATPHLHDPYGLGDGYFESCFRRIESALINLAQDFPGARRAG